MKRMQDFLRELVGKRVVVRCYEDKVVHVHAGPVPKEYRWYDEIVEVNDDNFLVKNVNFATSDKPTLSYRRFAVSFVVSLQYADAP